MTESPDYEVHKDDETGLYVAEHPTLPVSSCGETTEEALKNTQEAVRLYDEPEGDELPDYDMSELMDRVSDTADVQEMIDEDAEYKRGDRFYEDISYVSEDSPQRPLIEEHQTVYEVQRVLTDDDTEETLYYLQSTKGFETQLMSSDEIEGMEAYKPEVEE